MSVIRHQVRPGAYFDSIVLMQLQSALAELPGVLDSGAVMATATNLALLRSNGLLPDGTLVAADLAAEDLAAEDLLIAVKADSEGAADDALGRIESLLQRRSAAAAGAFRPRSLATAARALPEARWVLVSVPGRYAAGVAEDALDGGRHVFLYSDNVALADERALKRKARARGLLVMGPDCGTAIVAGAGLGFANRVRRGAIGLVGAAGTGLQAVTSRIHALGAGVSHALGTGGRDLHAEIGAVTARQGLDLLARDPETRVIVLISKPPAPAVAGHLLQAARASGKPVVVDFLGYPPPARRLGPLHFATSLGETAELAVALADGRAPEHTAPAGASADPGLLRGLFSGGTLAHEALQGLRAFLSPLASNVAMDGVAALADATESVGNTIVDLGADELTVGRLHPMIDPELCRRRLLQEAADPEVGLILLDVVLGWGAHEDPAGVLAPAIARARARGGERELSVAAIVVGTDEDPQGLDEQIERLREAGATVLRQVSDAVAFVVERQGGAGTGEDHPAVDPDALGQVAAINVGLESFHDSLVAQGARAVHVEWRPPAGGDERLMAILKKMKT